MLFFSSGVGFASVQLLARAGAKVYLAARNESRATGALSRLDAEDLGPGNGEVVWLKLDLSDPKAARQSAEAFLQKEQRLDILSQAIRSFYLSSLLTVAHIVNNAAM